jgi:ABC-type Fe3+-hydroxamate transport system substrate-binding protein
MVFTDQLHREVRIDNTPSRIISLVPSQTELLFELGLDEQIAGITRFCIHPEELCRNKPKIGGTKKININKINSINPDLIIANREENTLEDIRILEKTFPVWVSDVGNLDDALDMIAAISKLTGSGNKGEAIISTITQNFLNLKKSPPLSVVYLIWRNPFMSAGKDTFINDMINRCGWKNLLDDKPRYPKISLDDIKQLGPDLLLLSSEPYPFREKHISELQSLTGILPVLVDGEYFSWYGSRLMIAPAYFNNLINRTQILFQNRNV